MGNKNSSLDDSGDVSAPVARARHKLKLYDGGKPRPWTLSGGGLTSEERRQAALVKYPEGVKRPETRQDCIEGERPCPFVSCFYNLYLDVNDATGGIKLNFPHLEVSEMVESCVLDVSDRGGVTLEETAQAMNVSRERVRQIQDGALTRMSRSGDVFDRKNVA